MATSTELFAAHIHDISYSVMISGIFLFSKLLLVSNKLSLKTLNLYPQMSLRFFVDARKYIAAASVLRHMRSLVSFSAERVLHICHDYFILVV